MQQLSTITVPDVGLNRYVIQRGSIDSSVGSTDDDLNQLLEHTNNRQTFLQYHRLLIDSVVVTLEATLNQQLNSRTYDQQAVNNAYASTEYHDKLRFFVQEMDLLTVISNCIDSLFPWCQQEDKNAHAFVMFNKIIGSTYLAACSKIKATSGRSIPSPFYLDLFANNALSIYPQAWLTVADVVQQLSCDPLGSAAEVLLGSLYSDVSLNNPVSLADVRLRTETYMGSRGHARIVS